MGRGRVIYNHDCQPVSAAWDQSLLHEGGRCNNAQKLANVYYAKTAVNVATDWIMAFMPIPLLWDIRMNRNSKISVAFVLGLAFCASLNTCIPLKYTIGLTNSENYLYSISDIVILGYAETELCVIIGCGVALRPVFRQMLGDLGLEKESTRGETSAAANAYRSRGYSGDKDYEIPRPSAPRDTRRRLTATTLVSRDHDRWENLSETESVS